MDHFKTKNGELYCEDIPLAQLAQEVGTPAYLYSRATLRRHCTHLKDAFASYPTLPCYAVKANTNHSVLKDIFGAGFGADVVSVGELERALLAGAKPAEIVYSGVGKRDEEMERALDVGILSYNVESYFELDQLRALSRKRKKKIGISIRLNPHIDAKTNPYISTGLHNNKFGIAEDEARVAFSQLKNDPHLELIGLTCHIGSQITDLSPFREASDRLSSLAAQLLSDGLPLKILSLGGGLGIRYKDEAPPTLEDYAATLIGPVKKTGLRLVIEPGRSVVGNMGALLTRVIGVKKTPTKTFIIVDAAMNDLIRPALYEAYHEIVPVKPRTGAPVKADIVGPVCESGDFLAPDRMMAPVEAGDLLLVRSCGAYAASMGSNYNSRPKPPEIMVDGGRWTAVRKRETLSSIWQNELT